MKLTVSDEIRENYPDFRIGVVIASNIDNSKYNPALEDYSRKMFLGFADRFGDKKELLKETNIQAWRETYRSFGLNPKKKRPTAEALLSRVIGSRFVPHINPAVDCYLIAETLHFLPIGGYDLDKIDGDIVLRLSPGGEPFVGLGSDKVDETIEGEVVYSDDSGVLTRAWNYRDCDRAKIDEDTIRSILFIEAASVEIPESDVIATRDEVAKNLEKYCVAKVATELINIELSTIGLS